MLASWFWLFSKSSDVTQGLFGQGGQRTGTTTAQGTATNIQSSTSGTPATTATNGNLAGTQNINIPLTGSGGVSPVSVSPFGSTTGVGTIGSQGIADVPGVDWLGGASGAPTSNFTPSATNQLNSGATGGQVTIFGTPPQPTSQSNLTGLFAVAGIGTALCTAGLLSGAGLGALTSAANSAVAVQVNAIPQNLKDADSIQQRFLDCITRSIGRAVVNQITSSVVNWINGGFNGSPSFVQNYQQFFANVADLAAGEYIKGSALSFLCSPFQLQIKIAIAQSYANRNSGGGKSCSLSGATKNINNFINGNFNSGGWPAFLSFTTIPTNNPYGAYAYAQVGLMNSQQRALANVNKNITPGGFIGYVQTYDCKAGGTGTNNQYINNSSFLSPPQAAAQICPSNCKCKTATPGSVIESTLNSTESSTLNQLNLAKSFDEIMSALITQLITKTLQQGLSNISGTQGYASNFLTPDQQQAQSAGNSFLTTLQAAQQVSQQYGAIKQGSITDIQNSQQQLSNLSNCWETIATSDSYSTAQRNQAAGNASSTQQQIAVLEAQVAVHNNNITRANESIVAIQTLQSQTLQITSSSDLSTVQTNFNNAVSSGQIVTQNDVTQAGQDRTTLQSQLSSLNAQTATSLAQCRATTPAGQ